MKFADAYSLKRTSMAAILVAGVSGIVVSVFTQTAAGQDGGPRQHAVPLGTMCTGPEVQAIADTLPVKVSVGKIAEFTGPTFPDGTHYFPAAGDLPAFCQVTGSFVTNPATGRTANFLATLPANWNGKYLQSGCSGHCGTFAVSNPAMPTITITNQGLPGDIIRKGYAAFATDEGHTEMTGGTWAIKGPGAVDRDAITDYLFRSHKVLSEAGKAFTSAFYARATGTVRSIARSYFSGCSGGGRDALVAASYFPEAFDGIIAGSPYNLAGASIQIVSASLATLRSPDAYVPPKLTALVDQTVTRQCDSLDGVKDGLIQNPAACNFVPERDLPLCRGNVPGESCFTRAQIESVSVTLTAVTDEAGGVIQPGYSASNYGFVFPTPPQEAAAEDPWGDSPAGGLWSIGHATLKVFAHNNDPAFNARQIVTFRSGGPGLIKGFRAVVPRREANVIFGATAPGIGHLSQNFNRLVEQDRKLLIWHNLSDEKLTPYMSMNLYKQLAARFGGYSRLQQNVRLFSLPGTAHCSGGGLPVGPGSFDALSAMENWVEKRRAPDALLATLYQPTSYSADYTKPLGRTMPLCKFPEMARYKGTGSLNDASNWTCPSNDRSMLTVGESGRRAGMMR